MRDGRGEGLPRAGARCVGRHGGQMADVRRRAPARQWSASQGDPHAHFPSHLAGGSGCRRRLHHRLGPGRELARAGAGHPTGAGRGAGNLHNPVPDACSTAVPDTRGNPCRPACGAAYRHPEAGHGGCTHDRNRGLACHGRIPALGAAANAGPAACDNGHWCCASPAGHALGGAHGHGYRHGHFRHSRVVCALQRAWRSTCAVQRAWRNACAPQALGPGEGGLLYPSVVAGLMEA